MVSLAQWKNYSKSDGIKPFVERVVDILNPRDGEKILDAGSGNGEIAKIISSRGAEVTAIEKDALLASQSSKIGIKTLNHDITKLKDLKDLENKFDAVFSNMVFNWLEKKEDIAVALTNFNWAMKDNSRLVINTAFKETHMDDIIQTTMAKYNFDYDAVKARSPIITFSEEEIKVELIKAGFKNSNISIQLRRNELPNGIKDFLETFRLNYYFDKIADHNLKEAITKDVIDELKQTNFYDKKNDKWYQVVPNIEIISYKGLGRELHQINLIKQDNKAQPIF